MKIHLIGNLSAGGAVKQVKPKHEEVFAFYDDLSTGYLPPFGNLEDIHKLRSKKLFTFKSHDTYWWKPSAEEYVSECNIFLDQLRNTNPHKDRLVIWFARSLNDVIFLCFCVLFAIKAGFPISSIYYIKPTDRRFFSIGRIPPQDVKHLIGSEKQFSEEDLERIAKTWEALSANSPEELQKISDEMPEEALDLKAALQAHMMQYPCRKRGLSHADNLILQKAMRGKKLAYVLSNIMARYGEGLAEKEVVNIYGSFTLLERIFAMSKLYVQNPLLEKISENEPRINHASMELTSFGASVREGKENAVLHNGIDEWIGGVHLKSPDTIWFRGEDGRIFQYVV